MYEIHIRVYPVITALVQIIRGCISEREKENQGCIHLANFLLQFAYVKILELA